MIIDKKTVVSVAYTLNSRQGFAMEEAQVEKTDPAKPFVFLYGVGMLLPDFESNLKGKQKGDSFDFHIPAERGYGVRNDKHVMNIPVETFKSPDGSLDLNEIKVGNMLELSDQQGRQFRGKVLDVNAVQVRIDFNHPLAGHELHFNGQIVDVRAATAEELEHGHVHGPGGHHH